VYIFALLCMLVLIMYVCPTALVFCVHVLKVKVIGLHTCVCVCVCVYVCV